MRQIADNLWQLSGFPPDLFNVYLMGDVVVDGATRWATRRVLRQLRNRTVRLATVTHCHPDHQGATAAVCKQLGVPLACHKADVAAMEGREPMQPANTWLRLGVWIWAGPSHPVARVLRDGDEVAGFRVVHTPGHTPGHVIYFRESDRVAVAGDLVANFRLTGLREPPTFFSADAAQNRRSIRLLADLKPRMLCFGHGPPMTDLRPFERFVDRLPG